MNAGVPYYPPVLDDLTHGSDHLLDACVIDALPGLGPCVQLPFRDALMLG